MLDFMLCFRIINEKDSASALADAVAAMRNGLAAVNISDVEPKEFRKIPGAPFAYWAPPALRDAFEKLPAFEADGRSARQGLATADDFRFVRTAWEVDRGQASRRWHPFAKGGEHASFYADVHLAVNWGKDGSEIKQYIVQRYPYLNGKAEFVAKNPSFYFRLGLTWPRRTTSALGLRVLPAGCVFADKGPAAFVEDDDPETLLALMGVTNSAPFRALVSLQMAAADAAARSYEVGVIQRTPVPELDAATRRELATLALRGWALKRDLDSDDETSHAFAAPVAVGHPSITAAISAWAARRCQAEAELKTIQADIDRICQNLYGFDAPVADIADDSVAASPPDDENGDDSPTGVDSSAIAASLASWCLSVAFGRFGMNGARASYPLNTNQGQDTVPPFSAPFAALLISPPGMLQSQDGLPAKHEDVPADYPVQIDWDGILTDDAEHGDDIVRRIRDVLGVIWKDWAESIEREACEILGVRELRDYFRKPGNGGFWMDHVKRYSKSRRKAPIYWYLRSAKGNYGLWLYYHRLDKDTYFKCLVNYVEPKLRLEEDRLLTLRTRKTAVGSAGREAKQIEKDIDRQEQFVAELHDFRDKLRRVADLHLVPDLNDGVILNIAPLHELVPWKEAAQAWEALQDARYDWAHIAYQLWPDRVRDLCKRDRSVASAHGLEDICEVGPPKNLRAATPEDDDEEDGNKVDQDE